MEEWIVPVKKLVISYKTGGWCKLPYHNHPKGCPNYGKTPRCPPIAPNINEYFDIHKPLYIVHSEFDLKSHIERMKKLHPEWSLHQCKCVLYWQPKSRKQMKDRVLFASRMLKTNRITACPEAMGLNVFATALKSGLRLDKTNNINICRHISLIGYRRKGK